MRVLPPSCSDRVRTPKQSIYFQPIVESGGGCWGAFPSADTASRRDDVRQHEKGSRETPGNHIFWVASASMEEREVES